MVLFKSNKLNKKFKESGFVKLQLISSPAADKLKELYFNYKKNHLEYNESFHSTSDTSNHDLIRSVNSKIKNILLCEYDKLFINLDYFIANFLVKEPKADSAVSAHQDWTFVDEKKFQSVNIWVGLDQINHNNGCMWFIPKSHQKFKTLRLSPHFPAFYADYRHKLHRFGKHLLTQKGEGFVFDHGIIHGSTENKSNEERIAAVVGAYSKGAELLHYYMPDLNQKKIEKYTMTIEDFIQLKKDERPTKSPVEINLKHQYSAVEFKDFKKAHYSFMVDLENRLLRGF
tara:strand:+ start:4804 stop:5661 length:858 start_codon:yes stop_codon:yes gene_type:complete